MAANSVALRDKRMIMMTRFSTVTSANAKLLRFSLARAHVGKIMGTGLLLVLLCVSRFSPLGDFLLGAEEAWALATTRALPTARPARQQGGKDAQMGVRQFWEQMRGMIDFAVQMNETSPSSLPDAETLERYRQAETMSDLYPVTGTAEKVRQRIESGEVEEKGLLDLMAPEIKGGWRPAPPAPQR
jgi:hypothetical protein